MAGSTSVVDETVAALEQGLLPPWKVEAYLTEEQGLTPPEQFGIAAQARRRWIGGRAGVEFIHIPLPRDPYMVRYLCEHDRVAFELDAADTDMTCCLCGGALTPVGEYGRYAPLVNNYVGGTEDYYSYAGSIRVTGDCDTEFRILLQYGTGLGPIGVCRGCYMINRFGGARVKVGERASACRCLGFVFRREEEREQALRTISGAMENVEGRLREVLDRWQGEPATVEFLRADDPHSFLLFVDFTADFIDYRGHGAISQAVGTVKGFVTDELRRHGIEPLLSAIAQGYDGDLKPSPRNKRGRYAVAEVRIPLSSFADSFGCDPERLISFVRLDAMGVEKMGWYHHTGMGGEIIAGMYKATKVNPHSPLVSSVERIYAEVRGGDLVYGVELPNVEAGVLSCSEGLIPPGGREALRIMGVRTAREFGACLAAQVLAGELNLSLEIARERLYRPSELAGED
jgi:hypothetical protein